jgi:hypothetical protein
MIAPSRFPKLEGRSGLQILPKDYRESTALASSRSTLAQVMKRAFVLRLTPDTNPAKGKFQGHVEEVDTGRELKFRTVEEFLAFVQECIAEGSSGG